MLKVSQLGALRARLAAILFGLALNYPPDKQNRYYYLSLLNYYFKD